MLSTTKEEYISLIEGVNEAIWLRDMIKKLEISQEREKINCDS